EGGASGLVGAALGGEVGGCGLHASAGSKPRSLPGLVRAGTVITIRGLNAPGVLAMTVATKQRCWGCGRTKPLSEFHRDRRSKLGVQDWCKLCRRAYAKEHYKRNREAYKLASKNSRRRRKFGVSPEQYAAMHQAQKGLCAICGQPAKTRELHLDH